MNSYIDGRNIYFSDEITEATMGWLTFKIQSINLSDNEEEEKLKDYTRKPINLYISSYGGNVYDVLGAYDIIKQSKTKVNTYGFGKCMSAGLILFLAGEERNVYKNTTVMFHSLAGGVIGMLQKEIDSVEEHKRLQKRLNNIITKTTNIPKEKLEEHVKHKSNWYIDADDCLALNIAHNII